MAVATPLMNYVLSQSSTYPSNQVIDIEDKSLKSDGGWGIEGG